MQVQPDHLPVNSIQNPSIDTTAQEAVAINGHKIKKYPKAVAAILKVFKKVTTIKEGDKTLHYNTKSFYKTPDAEARKAASDEQIRNEKQAKILARPSRELVIGRLSSMGIDVLGTGQGKPKLR